MSDNIQIGQYQHFKTGKLYQVLGIAMHSETLEEMVLYKALYATEDFGFGSIWVRPKAMFFEKVNHCEKIVPRFKLITG